MIKRIVEQEYTFFEKQEIVSIDEVNTGEQVYLKVESPLNYGNREMEYYGRIEKITPCYFWILEYCLVSRGTNDWLTSEILKKELDCKRHTKQWAKKSVIELRSVKTTIKKEKREIYSSK